MSVSAKQVKELRDRTGAGMMDCKTALVESDGNVDKAIEWLQKKGIAKAAKRAGKVATEGQIHAYIHAGGRIGVLVEMNSETDFVARGDEFQTLVHDIAMHVCASSPSYVAPEEIPAADLEKQKNIFVEQSKASGKPEHIIEKMVEGRIKKWYTEVCLMNQPFVKDPDKSVGQLITDLSGKVGEKIAIRRFVRYEVGEGLEKKQDDLAAEVASMVGGEG